MAGKSGKKIRKLYANGRRDFQNIDLSGANLQGVNLQGANLQGANLQRTNLQGAKLQGANLQRANLQRANLQRANLQGANLREADLKRANLQGAVCNEKTQFPQNFDPTVAGVYLIAPNTSLRQANLQGADLQGANLQGANLQGADLQRANLQRANLQRAKLQWANLQGADLQGAKLQGADLQGANLQGANLQGADLQRANLQRANLQRAKLQWANLQWANLQGANLQGANLQGADLQRAKLQGADLQRAKLQRAKLQGAVYNEKTHFPQNFDPTVETVYLIAPNTSLRQANLPGKNLQGADLQGADLQGANLQRAKFQGAVCNEKTQFSQNFDSTVARVYLIAPNTSLRQANLRGADLQGANLQGADLQGADLQQANLQGVNLSRADLQGANLQGANLKQARLVSANLQKANLQKANLEGAILPLIKKMQGADLHGANLQGIQSPVGQKLYELIPASGLIPENLDTPPNPPASANVEALASLPPTYSLHVSEPIPEPAVEEIALESNPEPPETTDPDIPADNLTVQPPPVSEPIAGAPPVEPANFAPSHEKSQEISDTIPPTVSAEIEEVTAETEKLDAGGYFTPKTRKEAKERIIASVAQRQGQPKFRQDLLDAYKSRCAITGCDVKEALEAAHIIPYSETENNHPSNGLLLRADLHTLFDLNLIAIDPETMTVHLAPTLRNTDYKDFHGKRLRSPNQEAFRPKKDALKWRCQECRWYPS